MSYRSAQIYIRQETKDRIRLVHKLYPNLDEPESSKFSRMVTWDEVADTLLNKVIEKDYPIVIEVERKQAETLAEAIKKANQQDEEELPF